MNPSDLIVTADALERLKVLNSKGSSSSSNNSTTTRQNHHHHQQQSLLPLRVMRDFDDSSMSNNKNNNNINCDEERPFLQTLYNQIDDGKAYQSPWTGKCYCNNPNVGSGNGNNKTKVVASLLYKPSASGSGSKMRQQKSSSSSVGNNNNNQWEDQIRDMEDSANEVWDAYRQLYYGHDAVGSVFVRSSQQANPSSTSSTSSPNGATVLECFFGIHKDVTNNDDETKSSSSKSKSSSSSSTSSARWDSVHIVTVEIPDWKDKTCDYRIDSTVWCCLHPTNHRFGPTTTNTHIDLASILTKETIKKKCKLVLNGTEGRAAITAAAAAAASSSSSAAAAAGAVIPISAHLENIGTLLESIEMEFRTKLERVHMPKAVEVMQAIYRPDGQSGTVHLMKPHNNQQQQVQGVGEGTTTGDDNVTIPTGMGVGTEMIGEIATLAKSKGLGEDNDNDGKTKPKVLESMEQKKLQQEQQRKEQKENNKTANEYNDLKAGLKKKQQQPSSSSTSGAKVGPEPNTFTSPGGGNPWGDARAGLKSRNNSNEGIDLTSPTTPGRRAVVSATPEFVDFRNKLKSPMRK